MTNRSPWISIGTLIFLILLGPQPNSLSAQGIGVATRAGTMGVGAEVSLGFYEKFAIRGGFGKIDWDFMPEIPTSYFGLNFGLPGVDPSLAETKVLFPETLNVGADIYLTTNLRITGGILLQTGEMGLEGTVGSTGTVAIGSKSYQASDLETFKGTLSDNKNYIPYASIGLGNHSERGFGLFTEIGAAFHGKRILTLSATGNQNVIANADFQTELAKERTNLQEKIDSYLKIWPILSVGFRFSL
jgi:hypothetical protein